MPPKKIKIDVKSGLGEAKEVTYLSTGILSLDVSLGGGFSEGVMNGFFSVKSGGKSTTCINVMRSAQEKYPNKKILFILTESGGVTLDRMSSLGVDCSKVDFVEEMSIENIQARLTRASSENRLSKNEYSLIIIDSINNTTNQYDTEAQGVGYSRAAQFIGKLLKTLGDAIVARRNTPDETPLTVLVTMQASANMDMSFEKFVPKGGEALKHAMDCIVRFNSREMTFGADVSGTIKVGETDYALKHIKTHPIVKTFSENRKPWFLVNAGFYKHRGVFRDACAYVLSNLNADITNESPKEANLRAGKEYLPITLYDLATCAGINLKEGNGKIPCIDLETSSKDKLVKCLTLGVDPSTGVVVDYKKLIVYIIIKMRLSLQQQNSNLGLLPSDNYLCGMFFDKDEFYSIANKLLEENNKTLELSLQDYYNSLFSST